MGTLLANARQSKRYHAQEAPVATNSHTDYGDSAIFNSRPLWAINAVVLGSLYIPFAVLAAPAMVSICSSIMQASVLFLASPGFIAGAIAKQWFDDTGFMISSGLVTIAIVFVLIRLARSSAVGLAVSIVIALLISIPSAVFARFAFMA